MSPIVIRTKIVRLLNAGAFDLALFGNINKANIYQRFPEEVRESMAQSYFYKFLAERRLRLLSDKVLFMQSAEKYFNECQNAQDPTMLSLHICKVISRAVTEELKQQ